MTEKKESEKGIILVLGTHMYDSPQRRGHWGGAKTGQTDNDQKSNTGEGGRQVVRILWLGFLL